MGFFVEFNNDANLATRSLKPAFIPGDKWRYRLMDLRQDSMDLAVFNTTGNAWISNAMATGREARPIGDNVITLVFLARDSAGNPLSSQPNSYVYDSRDKSSTNTWNQLPAQIQVSMVVIDEDSAARLAALNGSTAPALVNPAYFVTPSMFAQDLSNLERDLSTNAARPNFRIFNTTVRIEAAKWSD